MDMEFIIFFLTILFVGVLQIFIPFITKRSVVFGVSIPYDQVRHPQVIQYKKSYVIITSVFTLASLAGLALLVQGHNVNENRLALVGVVFPFVILLVGLSLYFYFHYKITKLKQTKDWFGAVKQVHYADLKIRSKDEMLASFIYLIPVIISLGLIIVTVNLYDQLPRQIPTHWGSNGQADAFSDKSWMVALGMPIILILMQLMFYGINVFTKCSGIKINAGNVKSSELRQLRLRKYTSWFLFVVDILITLLFAILQLNLLYENIISDLLMMLAPLCLLIIVLVGTVWLAVKVGSLDSDFEGKEIIEDSHSNKVEGIDEDKYWIGGLFYFNRNDPSVFVEKRFGIGFTMNFANPIGYLILIVPIILIILIPNLF
ncbi:DUF1648 domain-containing protein [Niallia nealsonii]|uniref:DUF1648 domain-containing protein n=1 Tax=Niallia nealsonii TaxID=115979 RepID=A0A2N0YZH4_9BACI|nr:DUF1648 domain-containing protein [Niallia nealsonii]PKG22645.1 hypothetical protein CWS01_16070 [Niallia nealsonii]